MTTQTVKDAAASREKRLANLKPFKPGQSGNPSGRAKKVKEIEQQAREHAPEAIRTIAKHMKSDDPNVSLKACGMILDRAIGKSPEKVDVHQTNNTQVNVEATIPAVAEFIERFITGGREPDHPGTLQDRPLLSADVRPRAN